MPRQAEGSQAAIPAASPAGVRPPRRVRPRASLSLWLAGIGGLACFGALALAAALSTTASPPRDAFEQAADPFVGPAAARRLRAWLAHTHHRPHIPGAPADAMGWRWSDEDYVRQIPFEARQLPAIWSGLPGSRFRNTEIDGIRDVRLHETPHFDQWLLTDPRHHLRACIAVDRELRRAYFLEVERHGAGKWQRARSVDTCYQCHPSGPRLIRTLPEPFADRGVLERFNRRMLSYGACDLWGAEKTPWQGKPWADERCAACHDGVRRGRLYAIHRDPIVFKTRLERSMPPGG